MMATETVPETATRSVSISRIIEEGFPRKALYKSIERALINCAVRDRNRIYAIAGKTDPDAVELTGDEEAAIKWVTGAPRRSWNPAAVQGTAIHKLLGKPVDPDQEAFLAPYREWLDEQGVTILGLEIEVASTDHGFHGKLDLLAEKSGITGKRIYEVKTSESGVWPNDHIQAAAYARAYEETFGEDVGACVLHIRPEGVSEHWVDVPSAFEMFLGAKALAEYAGAI